MSAPDRRYPSARAGALALVDLASKAGTWDVRRGLMWPWPYLDSWRKDGQLSPGEEALNLG